MWAAHAPVGRRQHDRDLANDLLHDESLSLAQTTTAVSDDASEAGTGCALLAQLPMLRPLELAILAADLALAKLGHDGVHLAATG
jgi:hypothetical protein